MPDHYLGANIDRIVVDGDVRFTMSRSRDYIVSSVANVERTLAADGEPDQLSQFVKKAGSRPFLT